MNAMDAHLRATTKHTFREVARRNARRAATAATPRSALRAPHSPDPCQYQIRPEGEPLQDCGQPVTHTGVPPNYLRYCRNHAAYLMSRGIKLKALSPATAPATAPAGLAGTAGSASQPYQPEDPDERSPE